ncbi:MAG: hypothetical protein EA383_06890 [Spirochaetaceae bacterium]|nr:MAG: hypothetical protein EA383_06890 [Spirochaetaceae bacterium]
MSKSERTQPQHSRIHLAFRHHVNFYHSYRGDSLDERGIGKDIRIIRGTLDALDRLNAEGIPVRGTWDIENYFSLEYMMREHAPDLISRIQGRVRNGIDEVEAMSFNNGLVAASNPEEFTYQMRSMKTNPQQSGLDDLFSSWAPILRPQECMYTPSFLREYPRHGISTISLYYSAVPFNGFSNFVRPLSLVERYNPLTLQSSQGSETMTLLPCYNHGDLADHYLSLRRWLKHLRRQQIRLEHPQDLLLILDADADDEFWAGLFPRGLRSLCPSFAGMYHLAKSVADLPWLTFSTPGTYLEDHEAVASISIGQDTADGSFDGYSSWAEKWENTELWTMIQRSRDLWTSVQHAVNADPDRASDSNLQSSLERSLRLRVLSLSTTHFGLASPVMNPERLAHGVAYAHQSLQVLLGAWLGSGSGSEQPDIALPPRRTSESARYMLRSSRKHAELVRVQLVPDQTALPFVHLDRAEPAPVASLPEAAAMSFQIYDPQIRYGSSTYPAVISGFDDTRDVASGSLDLPGQTNSGSWTRRTGTVPGPEGLFMILDIRYPLTPDRGWNRKKAVNLNRRWDARWKEVIPAEISPRFTATADSPFRIIKRNFFGDVSSYAIDYHQFSRNRNLASINNHITNSWIAVTNGVQGLLIAQHTGFHNNFAFCPVQTGFRGESQWIRLNPFGTWYGRQYAYPTARTGIGRAVALKTADQLDSYAPSWNGKSLKFALAVFPFSGDTPSPDIMEAAEFFSVRTSPLTQPDQADTLKSVSE